MNEAELKEIEKEVEKLPKAWFFHDMAMAMINEIKRLNKQIENQEK